MESLPSLELDHLLSNFFLNSRRKTWRRATISSLQRSIQRHSTQRKYPVNTLKDNEFEKSSNAQAAQRKSLVHEHGKASDSLLTSSKTVASSLNIVIYYYLKNKRNSKTNFVFGSVSLNYKLRLLEYLL